MAETKFSFFRDRSSPTGRSAYYPGYVPASLTNKVTETVFNSGRHHMSVFAETSTELITLRIGLQKGNANTNDQMVGFIGVSLMTKGPQLVEHGTLYQTVPHFMVPNNEKFHNYSKVLAKYDGTIPDPVLKVRKILGGVFNYLEDWKISSRSSTSYDEWHSIFSGLARPGMIEKMILDPFAHHGWDAEWNGDEWPPAGTYTSLRVLNSELRPVFWSLASTFMEEDSLENMILDAAVPEEISGPDDVQFEAERKLLVLCKELQEIGLLRPDHGIWEIALLEEVEAEDVPILARVKFRWHWASADPSLGNLLGTLKAAMTAASNANSFVVDEGLGGNTYVYACGVLQATGPTLAFIGELFHRLSVVCGFDGG